MNSSSASRSGACWTRPCSPRPREFARAVGLDLALRQVLAADLGLDPAERKLEDEDEKIGDESDEGPAREHANEATVDLDDVVRRLVGLGGTAATTEAVAEDSSSPGEPALDEPGGPGYEPAPGAEAEAGKSDSGQDEGDGPPQLDGEAQRDAGGPSEGAARQPSVGGQLWLACEGECRRDLPSGAFGVRPELPGFEDIVDLGGRPCDDVLRECQSVVLEEVNGERCDGRYPVFDFRIALTERASLRDEAVRCARVPAVAAATSWRSSIWPSGSLGSPRCASVVAQIGRGGRCLSLLGPRGPPLARAPRDTPWCDCEREVEIGRAETDRG